MVQVTPENYYSHEVGKEYFSASQVKAFLDCEARALAEINGEYERPTTPALLIGSFVDSWFESDDSFADFNMRHPEIRDRNGKYKADFQRAVGMIERAQEDEVFMDYMTGETQKILVGEIDGVPFRCKMDVYSPGKRIVDLKTTKDFEPVYKEGQGKVSFCEAYHYPLQMAIYRELEGNHLPCYIAAISKQDPPDLALIEISHEEMDAEMQILRPNLMRYDAIKRGLIPPERCGKCAYCRATHKLQAPVSLMEFE